MDTNEPTSVRIRIRPGKAQSAPVLAPSLHAEGALQWKAAAGEATEFQYDKVYGQDSTQAQVFVDCHHVIDTVLKGCNGCILAYGQTGSGKTHSLFGAVRDVDNQGIVPRAITRLGENLAHVASEQQGTVFRVTVSIVEIYCERIRCLVADTGKDNLAIKTDPLRGTFVEGATEVEVCDESELEALLNRGLAARSVSATAMNAESSRSHCVVTIRVEQFMANGEARLGKLVLGDLAGSERASKTGAQGTLLTEGALINKGLSCLANVIYALTETSPGSGTGARHVPYRDSKLTRLLQDSLGGTARTVLLCCCSPDADNAAETLSTLRFGSRAKGLTCRLQVNQRLSAERLQELLNTERRLRAALEKEVETLRQTLSHKGVNTTTEQPLLSAVCEGDEGDSSACDKGTAGHDAASHTTPLTCAAPSTQLPSATTRDKSHWRVELLVDAVWWLIMVCSVLGYMNWEDARRHALAH